MWCVTSDESYFLANRNQSLKLGAAWLDDFFDWWLPFFVDMIRWDSICIAGVYLWSGVVRLGMIVLIMVGGSRWWSSSGIFVEQKFPKRTTIFLFRCSFHETTNTVFFASIMNHKQQ